MTTCNGMHADRLPSADPWCFQGRLRWKQNREVLKSCANSRQFDWLSITRRGKVLAAYLQGQSSPTGRTHGPDKSPDFFFFFFLWVALGQACHRGSGSQRPLSCRGASRDLTSCHIAAVFVKAQQKTSLPLSACSMHAVSVMWMREI